MSFLNLRLGSPVVPAAQTVTGELEVVGARFIVAGDRSGGRLSLVEHPIVARGLAAPVHRHRREDEVSSCSRGWGPAGIGGWLPTTQGQPRVWSASTA